MKKRVNLTLVDLVKLQEKALDAAIQKAKETAKFKTPQYFLNLWLHGSFDKNEYSNLFEDDSKQGFLLRLKNGTYINPEKMLLQGTLKKKFDNYFKNFGKYAVLNGLKQPEYFRARLKAIEFAMRADYKTKELQERSKVLIRNGVFLPELDAESLIQASLKEHKLSNEPLNFMELCSFNTWFNLHPEKVAGKEIISSSREFPISIKGTKQDIIDAISNSKKQISNSKDFSFQLELKLKTSKTKLKLLKY